MKIYNTLTKQKETFKSIEPNKINMYVCGPTVYDHCHLGHARTYVSFDVMYRYFTEIGYDVNYTRNITDIDDKIIKRAQESGEPEDNITQTFTQSMHDDFKALNLLPPRSEPKATETIPQIIDMIEKIIANGNGYVASNGDVYFDVSSYSNYGALSKKDLSGQEAGARVDVVDVKKNPFDFVLWKMSKAGEPKWPSPWGEGRPGWHIECSAMVTHTMKPHIDIHGGGFDLIFPHHENELAQSVCANESDFVNYWMHVGFLTINKEKMSKSLKNFFTIKEALEEFHPEVIRYFLLSSQYRTALNYSLDNLHAAKNTVDSLYTAIRGVHPDHHIAHHYMDTFHEAMQDDFNTPKALSVIFDVMHELNKTKQTDMPRAEVLCATLLKLANIIGILSEKPEQYFKAKVEDSEYEKIESLIAKRTQARIDKNWQMSDDIRDELSQLGIIIEDSSEGTTWRKES